MDADALRTQPHHVVLDRLLGGQQDEADLRPPVDAPIEPDVRRVGDALSCPSMTRLPSYAVCSMRLIDVDYCKLSGDMQ